jgi:hypothetical protein
VAAKQPAVIVPLSCVGPLVTIFPGVKSWTVMAASTLVPPSRVMSWPAAQVCAVPGVSRRSVCDCPSVEITLRPLVDVTASATIVRSAARPKVMPCREIDAQPVWSRRAWTQVLAEMVTTLEFTLDPHGAMVHPWVADSACDHAGAWLTSAVACIQLAHVVIGLPLGASPVAVGGSTGSGGSTAAALLDTVDLPDHTLPTKLRRVLPSKDNLHYSPRLISKTNARALVRQARALVDAAERL